MPYAEFGLVVIGILLMCFAFIMKTQNTLSTVIFNIFPFFSGVYVILCGAAWAGWIVVGR